MKMSVFTLVFFGFHSSMSTPSRRLIYGRDFLALFFLMFTLFSPLYSQQPPDTVSIEAELTKARAYLVSFRNDSAQAIVEQLIDQLEEMDQLHSPLGIRVQLTQATALERDDQDTAAIEKLLYVREISQENDLNDIYTKACLVLANLYEKLDRPEAALEQLRYADRRIKAHDLEEIYPYFSVRISSWHRIFGQRDSAHFYAREALATAPKFGLLLEEAIGHMLMGMLMRDSSDYASLQHYFSGLRLYKLLEDYAGCSYMFSGISHYYDRNGKPELALAYTDSMIAFTHKATAQGNENHHSLSRTYRFRGALFKELGQNDSAWYYLEKGYELELQMAQQNTKDKVIEIDAKYRDEKQAQRLEEQALQIKYNQARRNALIAFSFIVVLFLIALGYYYLQLKKANKKTQEQADTLQQLNQARSRFFANISHELRTPLTLIVGPLSVMLDQPRQWDQQFVRKHLSMIRRNGQNLMRLVEEILDISRMDENKLTLNEDDIELLPFVESVFSNFITQFSYQNLSYAVHHDVKENLWIKVDSNKLEKVLNNFLSNAMKHTSAGGNVALILRETDHSLEFNVSDTGKGIHSRDIPFIFDRFYQSQQQDSPISGGTGIGLSLVKDIAQLMKGEVTVESALGKGSTFTFLMPKTEVSPKKIAPKVSGSLVASHNDELPSGSVFTVLIVEDNFDMREFIRELLLPNFKQILVARNGVEALEILSEKSSRIDLIISDMMMPEMDGLTLVNSIRSNPDWANIPTIMLTALATEKDRLTALRAGVDDYLTKPFSVTELLARVNNLLFNHEQRKKVAKEDPLEEELLAISSSDQEWMKSLEQKIADSLSNGGISVQLLADTVHVSPRQLSRKVKGLTGMTPRKLIREVQLQVAREELEGGKANSLLEVAQMAGFQHQGTFSTLFKSRFGKSPGEYLRIHSQMS